MGDVQTHAEIARAVIPLLGADEAPLFEVGNWLTDVSQFRDPFAHIGGKSRIFTEGLSKFGGVPRFIHLADVFYGLDNYLDELCGVTPEGRVRGTRPGADPAKDRPDDGLLARWFRAILVLITCNPTRLTPLKLQPGLETFSKPQIKAVFDARFTQYFPHEHVDFPPFPPNLPQRGTREPSTVTVDGQAASPARKLHDYTEKQLLYLADLLTRIERDWAHDQAADLAVRRERVAEFGHASHAIEDWFFHSNFVETCWELAHPGEPAPHAVLPPPPPEDIESFGPVPTENTFQRRLHRRLRSPRFTGDSDTLSTETSDPVTLLFTGSYGSNDLFFSLIDALGHVIGTRPTGTGVHSMILTQLHDALFGTEDEQKASLKRWLELCSSGKLVTAARVGHIAGQVEDFEVEAIEEICRIEKHLAETYPRVALFGLLGDPMGVLGLVQQMFTKGRAIVKESLEHGAEIDQDPARGITDDRSDNGSPGENLGSHSLLCKDSTRKEPLREATLRLATYTATYVAKTMVDRTPARSPAQPEDFVDWLELLRYFITHPAQASGGAGTEWWRKPLEAIDPRPPEGHTVVLKALADLPADADQTKLAETEQPYYDTAVFAEEQFKSTVDVAMVENSMISGLILGGVTGIIAGGIAGGRHGVGEAFAGMGLGLVTGAVVAGATSGLTAGVGLLINRNAGVTIASYTGIVGGSVAAGFAAAAVGGAL
ncbi:MAG: hypothetical protein M3O94_00715 [Actinomycetota bacterium]|nr:hypothetical protein [Actinomycetota bacterium]